MSDLVNPYDDDSGSSQSSGSSSTFSQTFNKKETKGAESPKTSQTFSKEEIKGTESLKSSQTFSKEETKGTTFLKTSQIFSKEETKGAESPKTSQLFSKEETKGAESPKTSQLFSKEETKGTKFPKTSQIFSKEETKGTGSPTTSQTLGKEESQAKTTHSPHTTFPKISPRKMLLKLEKDEKTEKTECFDKVEEMDIQKLKEEDKTKNDSLVPTEFADILPDEKNIKQCEEKEKNKNLYVVSKEFVDIMSNVTANTEESDSIGSELEEIIDSPPSKKNKMIKKKLKEYENVTLNIAITGMTGAGKSSFVNAMRGLRNDDVGAASTGTTETTMEPHMYPHPSMPNVRIWDLPGIGSPRFQEKKYLKDVKFDTYDFFLIVASERFKENDIKLARAIHKKNKLFYFIRTKIDNDIRAESNKKNFNERMLLDKIREDCKENLLKVGIPNVFLISSFHLDKYDFEKLIKILEDELPNNKKFALIQSLPVYSLEALTKKKTYFKKLIWLYAIGAGAGAIPPIPGLSVICDYGILKKFFQQVFIGFGLSDQYLESLSERVNKPVAQLKAAKTSRFKDGITEDVLMEMISKPIIAIAKTLGTIMALLPGGTLPAGGTAVATVHYLLNKGLNEMAEDTKNVLAESQLA